MPGIGCAPITRLLNTSESSSRTTNWSLPHNIAFPFSPFGSIFIHAPAPDAPAISAVWREFSGSIFTAPPSFAPNVKSRSLSQSSRAVLRYSSNPQPIGFSGILLAKRQNSFYCTYFLHNRNVADTKSPYPIKRLEVIRWFNQKSMVFNQSLS